MARNRPSRLLRLRGAGGGLEAQAGSAAVDLLDAVSEILESDPLKALELTRKILVDAPTDLRALRLAAFIILDTEVAPLEEASSLLQQAHALSPSDATILRGLGAATERGTGNASAAAQLYSRAVACDPSDAAARCALAVALEESGDVEGADAMMNETLALFPDSPSVRNDFAGLLRYCATFPCAPPLRMAAQQQRIAREEPLTERGSRGRGRGEEGAKAAEVELRRALALDPAHVSALHNLAVGLMGQVPPRPAGTEATEAGLDASGAAAFAEGEALLRQAFERSPRDPDVLVGLAEARPPQPRPLLRCHCCPVRMWQWRLS